MKESIYLLSLNKSSYCSLSKFSFFKLMLMSIVFFYCLCLAQTVLAQPPSSADISATTLTQRILIPYIDNNNCVLMNSPQTGSTWPNNQLYNANLTGLAWKGQNSETRTIVLQCPSGTVASGTNTLTTVYPSGSGVGVETMDFRLSLLCCPIHYQWVTTPPTCSAPTDGNCIP